MPRKTQAPMSPAKAASIAKAQAASHAKNKQGGPRARGLERAHKVIEWIYRWGWSTPTVLEILVDSKRSGLANRLVKSGIFHRIPTPSGGINNTPSCLLTLTQKGLEKAVELTDREYEYETDPHRISLKNVPHDEVAQRLAAVQLNDLPGIASYLTNKSLAAWNSNEVKIPDVMWKRSGFGLYAIEIELTPKFRHEFDRFVTMTAKLISMKDQAGKNVFAGGEIYFKSPTMLKRYSEAFAPGVKTPLWFKEKGKTGRWQKETNDDGLVVFSTMKKEISEHIKFFLITPWMLKGNPFKDL